MSNPPAYQCYAADFDEDTAAWDNYEIGVYKRLLNYSWINGWREDEGLPDDTKMLARIVRCSHKRFLKSWVIVSKKFSQKGNGFLINRRLEEERSNLLKYKESQRESGKRGAVKRWKKDSEPNGDPIGDPNSEPNGERYGESMALQSSSSNKERKDYTVLLKQSEHLCQTLSTFFKNKKMVWQWRQQAMNNNIKAELIQECLEQLWKYRSTARDPTAYMNHIIQIKHQNANEAKAIAEHEAKKLEFNEIARKMGHKGE